MKKKVILFTFLDPKMFWENPVFKSCADSVLEKIRKKFEMDENGEIVFNFFDPILFMKKRSLEVPGVPVGKETAELIKEIDCADRFPAEMMTFASLYMGSVLLMISNLWEKNKNDNEMVIVVEDEHKFSLSDPYFVKEEITIPGYTAPFSKHSPGSIFMLSEVLKG